MVGYNDSWYVMMMQLVVNLVVLIHSSCFYTHIHYIYFYLLCLSNPLITMYSARTTVMQRRVPHLLLPLRSVMRISST